MALGTTDALRRLSMIGDEMEQYTRRVRRLAGIVVATMIACVAEAAAEAKDTITWRVTDFPPYMIVAGPDRQHGLHDQIQQFLQARLLEYQHEQIVATFPRLIEEIKNGKHWCYVNGTKNDERQDWAYFSLPTIINLPYRIIVHKDQRAKFQRFGIPLSLETLLADRSLHTVEVRGQSFNPAIDALLRRLPPAQSPSFAGHTMQMYKMLLYGRIDYLIGLPLAAFYSAKQLGYKDSLAALRFQEAGEEDITRVMCPKNEWGKSVIEQINVILRRERPKPEYRRLMEAWQDEDGVREVRRLYDSVFLQGE